MKHWHQMHAHEVIAELGSQLDTGLSTKAAAQRLQQYGANDVNIEEGRSPLRIFAGQFAEFLILVLLVAAVISGFVGELIDTIAILLIVVLNAVVGAIQEYRAQRAVAALRQMAAPEARVVRDEEIQKITATEVVPGDLVILEAGDVVPADLRLIEVTDLKVDESALTGESLTVAKSSDVLESSDLAIGDRRNMTYKGTSVTRGRAKGVVVGTGADAEIGRIADLLRKEGAARTPLQLRLARFGRHLALAILAVCAVVFFVGLLQGQPPLLMFLTAVSLAVAAVPEALPAVVTISLALGARKLARHRALARRLPAVETLGSVTFICSDKTGTLTENRMTVTALVSSTDRRESLTDTGSHPVWRRFGEVMALNNEVKGTVDGLVGDPTELALHRAADDAGYDKQELLQLMPLIGELSFDAERKLMTTLHRTNDGAIAFVKGAPEEVLAGCEAALGSEGRIELDREGILEQGSQLAGQGYRVLALAFREFHDRPPLSKALESDLTLLGLVGLTDPPRPEVPQAVADARTAGIVSVMITGDHPDTAHHIASSLGIIDGERSVMTGSVLAKLSDQELDRQARDVRVYARVDPAQKIRIVAALQRAGEFVAMTGDGVNDAPALKRADIGVAMGKRGTDVAREAADMVLLDDNFATIVGAVREGRRIFDNIRKFIKYTMTSNSGEIWTLLLAPFFGLPIPLLPIHILWINLLTDGLPGLALSAEPAERGVMKRPPRPPAESIFAHGMWQHMLWIGLLIGALSIGAQALSYRRGDVYWQTMVFTTLVIAQLFQALGIRSNRNAVWTLGLATNPQLLGAIALTVAAQLAVIYVPALNPIFKTSPLPLPDLLTCFGLGSVVLLVVELEKWLARTDRIYGNG